MLQGISEDESSHSDMLASRPLITEAALESGRQPLPPSSLDLV